MPKRVKRNYGRGALHFLTFRCSQRRSICGWQRMMFVHDTPSSVAFAKSHRQTELEAFFFTVAVAADTPPDRCGKSNVLSRGDLNVLKVKRDRLRHTAEKQVPRRHVRIQTAGQKRRRHVEHKNVWIVIRSDSGAVLVTYRF